MERAYLCATPSFLIKSNIKTTLIPVCKRGQTSYAAVVAYQDYQAPIPELWEVVHPVLFLNHHTTSHDWEKKSSCPFEQLSVLLDRIAKEEKGGSLV